MPIFAYNRNRGTQNARIPYFGISRDTHPEGRLDVNGFTKNMADLTKGRSLADATVVDIRASRADVEDARVLQFITHTTPTPQGPGLALDRLLTWDDLSYDLRLKADVVLLTACGSIGPEPVDLGEAFSSLSRGFLASGAANVIASRWEIRQDDAKDFSEQFLRNYQATQDTDYSYFRAIGEFRKRYPTEPGRWASWILLGS